MPYERLTANRYTGSEPIRSKPFTKNGLNREREGDCMTAQEKMKLIANVLDRKKAEDIRILNVSDLTVLADCFIICSAPSTTQVKALGDAVEEEMDKVGEALLKKEGKQGLNWILMDYGDVIVHIFYQETRDFYGLEKLWADAAEIELDSVLVPQE